MFEALKELFKRNGDSPSIPKVAPEALEGMITKGDFSLNLATARRLLEFNTTGTSGAMDCIWTYKINVAYYHSENGNFVEVVRDLGRGGELNAIRKVKAEDVMHEYGMVRKFPSSYHLIYVDQNEIHWQPEVL